MNLNPIYAKMGTTIFEHMSAETVIGSGVTQNKAKQMEVLSYNAAKAVEKWLLEHPEWFGLPPKPPAPPAPPPGEGDRN